MSTPPRLDEQLCFQLYTASRLLTRAYRPHLKALDLTYPQYLAMMVLWEWDTEPCESRSIRALGRRLHLDSGTLTPLLRRLEQKELVRRCRCENDERIRNLELTDAGRALGEEAAKVPGAMSCWLEEQDLAQLGNLREEVRWLTEKLAEREAEAAHRKLLGQ